MAWVEADGTPHDAPMALRGAAVVSPAGAVRLFAGAPRSLEEVFAAARAGRPGSFTLPLRARMQVASRIEGFSSPNIVALLPGSDPALRDQYVTYVAHLDHLGHCPAADGDGICHGAFDNASGVAGLLEVARAFAALPQPPRRSILFLFSTGEEKGLLGSDYFAQHPTVPAAGLVGVICIDGLAGILYPSRDIIALGMDDSGLARDVAWAARATGYDISPDPSPQSVGLVRSDQYSFIRRGVPSVVMVSGVASLDPAVDRRAAMRDWGITHYHTPRDSMSEPLDFAQAARGARLNFLAGFSAAQRPDPPAWNPGDFFGARFAGGSAR
jgi:Zn-dependent M28 family amino/carboxypeptidase